MSKRKKFVIVTLIDENIEALNTHTCRDLFYKYKHFDDFFDVVDIRNYNQIKTSYKLTIIDRFATTALMIWENFEYEHFVEIFKNAKNLVFLTSDLHYWAIFPNVKLPENFLETNLEPQSNTYELLFDLFNKLDMKHLITHYECPELEYIKNNSTINTHVINYHIDPNVFKDYKLEKIYDVIFYGATIKAVYPFRNRLKGLLKQSKLNVLFIEDTDNIRGIELAKLINQSWLGIATISNFSYLVGKYFEISACNTVIVGNMNEQGKEIWADNYIDINEAMTDEGIITIIESALLNKAFLMKRAHHMYNNIHNFHTIKHEKNKLYQTCESIVGNKGIFDFLCTIKANIIQKLKNKSTLRKRYLQV